MIIYILLIFIDEKILNIKVLVEVKNGEEVFLRSLIIFFCIMVNNLKFEYFILFWIDKGNEINLFVEEIGNRYVKYMKIV